MLRRFWGWWLGKLELALADLRHHRQKWSWSYEPSRQAAVDKREARLERRIAWLKNKLGDLGSTNHEEAGE